MKRQDKLILMELTPYEIIVLRSALVAQRDHTNKKYRDACREIMRKSRAHDNPLTAIPAKVALNFSL